MRLLMLALLCLICSCGRSGNYARTVSNAVASDPTVSSFATLFPHADHFISYFTATYGQPRWNSKVVLHGRYVLTMQFQIDIDRDASQIHARTQPSYTLVEVAAIQRDQDGRLRISYTSTQLHFGPTEWQRLQSSGGDLSVLGIDVVLDEPVEGLDSSSGA